MLKNWDRLALVACAVVIPAIIGISAWIFHVNYRNEIAVQSQKQMLAITDASVNGVEEFIREMQRDLATAAKFPEIQNIVQNSILETEGHEREYHLFKAFSNDMDSRINAYYLLDAKGVVLDRFPIKWARIGASYAEKPGISHVLKERKSYVSPIFFTSSNESGFSVLEPVFKNGELVGILRAVVYIEKIYEHFMQTVNVGKEGYMILLGSAGNIYYHPNQKLMGKSIGFLQSEDLDNNLVREIELLKRVLLSESGTENLALDESSNVGLRMAWSYISTNPSNTGVAQIKVEYDDTIQKNILENRARVIASELDKAISKPGTYFNKNNLRNVIENLQQKYTDVVEVTVYGPRSVADDTLVAKQSSRQQSTDTQIVAGQAAATVEFITQKPGTAYAGADLIEVTVPIRTSKEGWFLIAAQPLAEIAAPINANARIIFGLAGVLFLSFGFGGFLLYRMEKSKAILQAETQNLEIIKQTSAELSDRNVLMNNLFESLTHPLYLIDVSDYRVIMANSAAGFGELTDTSTCYRLTHGRSSPCGHGDWACPLEEVLRTKKTAVMEHTDYDSEGNARNAEVHGYPVLDSDGNVIQMIEYSIDITARKQLEAQLLQSQKMESIGVLAGGIAHDFNNILTPIFGYTDIALMQLPPDSPVRESLEKISSSADRARNLVRQILTLSRQDSPEFLPVDMGKVVQEDLSLLRASLPPNIEIKTHLDPDCGSVLANVAQLSQVTMNLCTNAFHAMKKEGGTLTVSLEPVSVGQDSDQKLSTLKEGEYLKLTVQDTGHGMDSKTLHKIFNPFFTTKHLDEGTGLGLSVVHGIVQALKGGIFAESVVDQGTTLTIYLPKIDQPAAVIPVADITDKQVSGHILFVDDEKEIVLVAEQILSRIGYKLTVMTDSEKALELFKQDPAVFDLVILDMMMPKMSGTQLARAMLKIHPDVDIIMATGLMTQSSVAEFDQLGIKEKLSKPYTSKEVADAIYRVMV